MKELVLQKNKKQKKRKKEKRNRKKYCGIPMGSGWEWGRGEKEIFKENSYCSDCTGEVVVLGTGWRA